MTRSEYVDILLADFRPEDAEELQRLIVEEIDEVLDNQEELVKQSEDFAKKFRERYPERDQLNPPHTD